MPCNVESRLHDVHGVDARREENFSSAPGDGSVPSKPFTLRLKSVRRNKLIGSKSLPGGVLLYPRTDVPGRWQVMWRTPDGRRYKCFPTAAEAGQFANEMSRHRKMHGFGSAAVGFSTEEARRLADFREATGNAPLDEILKVWKAHKAIMDGIRLGVLIERFLKFRRTEGASPDTVARFEAHLYKMADHFGYDRLANSITLPETREWAHSLTAAGMSAGTVIKHVSAASGMFRRGVMEEWNLKNPFEGIVMPKVQLKEVTVMPLADAIKLFEVNKDDPVVLRLALEAFSGLRYSSAQRLALEDLNFEEKTIVMAGANHKSRRRHLLEGMPDNVWPWLLKFRDRPEAWDLTSKAYLYRKMHAFQRAGVPNPGNILRHSFCSYHVALHRDAAKTAVLMQHTKPSTLYRHYKGMARQVDAERYFQILP